MMIMGTGSAFLIFSTLLNSGLIPGFTADGRRTLHTSEVKFTVGIGDIFIHSRGKVAPPADPYEVLSEHQITWGNDGFRVPAVPADNYDILALGDSYTESANVALPWPDVLAAQTGIPVRNLGFRGYGQVEENHVLRNYGLKGKHLPKVVIIGYFEGNDLNNLVSAGQPGSFVLPDVARLQFEPFNPDNPIWKSETTGSFQYPVTMELNGAQHPIVFLDGYITALNAERATFDQSKNLVLLRESLQETQFLLNAAVDNGNPPCLLFAYFPDKSHIYLPYVVPADRDRMMSTVYQSILAPDDPILLVDEKTPTSTFETVIKRLDNQRDAVKTVVEEMKIPFLDLTPAFQDAAKQGQLLYYAYDTHWNQAGHDLTGKIIADYLISGGTCNIKK